MGLIGMNTHAVQEKNWGNRFIEKSAMDKNAYSTSADLGIGFSRLLRENLNISLQMVNGEGYKKPQGDKYHKISFNATYGERKLNKNDGYNVGVVYSTEATDSNPTNMIAACAAALSIYFYSSTTSASSAISSPCGIPIIPYHTCGSLSTLLSQ